MNDDVTIFGGGRMNTSNEGFIHTYISASTLSHNVGLYAGGRGRDRGGFEMRWRVLKCDIWWRSNE